MFKVLSLSTTNHPFFGDSSFNFVNEGEENNGPYVSLLIGSNGTGKSQILGLIVEIFNQVFSAVEKERHSKFEFDFEFKYSLDGVKYIIQNSDRNVQFIIDDIVYHSIYDLEFPSCMLALAINLTDRFPTLTAKSKVNNSRYKYLGIRAASNNAFISNHLKKIIKNLHLCLEFGNSANLLKLFSHLNLSPNLSISFKAGSNFVKSEDSYDISLIINKLDEVREKILNKVSDPLYFERNLKIKSDLHGRSLSEIEIGIIEGFIGRHPNLFNVPSKRSFYYAHQVDLGDVHSISSFLEDYAALAVLDKYGIIKYDTLHVNRLNTDYSFEQSSSGEYHMLSSFIGILAHVKENSLILIDEPEISLHPNWQLKYMELFNYVFEDYSSSHFIIASHSHFLVSDLKSESSSIVSLSIDSEGLLQNELLHLNTEGWSPENILYRVFGVANTRNYYFENDLREALIIISKNQDRIPELRTINERLSRFKLSENDPLKIVLLEINQFLERV